MKEIHYHIHASDGVFRMDKRALGSMLSEIVQVERVSRIEASAQGPMLIVRLEPEDIDQADPIVNILTRYGISSRRRRIPEVLHLQCHSRELDQRLE
jgi:hypothetical protein